MRKQSNRYLVCSTKPVLLVGKAVLLVGKTVLLVGKALALMIWRSRSNFTKSGISFYRKRDSTAHSLPSSRSHRPDMTEILWKRT